MDRPNKAALLARMMGRQSKKDFLHSSGYAKIRNGEGMGAVSTESFVRRRAIDRGRSRVRTYGESRLVVENQGVRKKTELSAREKLSTQSGQSMVDRSGLAAERAKLISPQIKPDFER